MSISATAHATDKDLRDLGLLKKGDIISLKRYCLEVLEDEEKKGKHKEKVALLETILEENKSKRKLEAPTGDSTQLLKKRKKGKPSEKKALKKIQLGWLHYDEKQKRFVAVRQTKGGGTRDVNFTLDTTADEIIEMGKMLFYPEGFCCFGNVEDMEFSLANYKQEIIHSVIVDNKVVPFTLQRYMYSTKLPKVRLYLASKAKISAHEEKEPLQAQPPLTTEATEDLPEDPFDEILFSPMFDVQTTRALKAEQDKAYFESLNEDKTKTEKRKQELLLEMQEAEKQENMRQARLQRVPDEPPPGDDAVLVQVRHVNLGIIKRRFHSIDKMMSVYDWVGSRSLLPIHFELSSYQGQVFMPEQSVVDIDNLTLNMVGCEATPGLGDDEISFMGYGCLGEADKNDTIPFDLSHDSESFLLCPDVMEVNTGCTSDQLLQVHNSVYVHLV